MGTPTPTPIVSGMDSTQITSVSTALTSAINGVISTFVDLLPVIALTTGAIFAIKFIKGRFRKVENIR